MICGVFCRFVIKYSGRLRFFAICALLWRVFMKKWRISAGLRCFFVAHPAFCGCFFSVYNNKNNLLLTIFNKLD